MVDHLKDLGVTAIELMPVHQFVHDDVLIQRGLSNYWGYNTHRLLRPAQRLRRERRSAASRCRSSS